MVTKTPVGELAPEFSDPKAAPLPWSDAKRELERAETYWISTVRPDGKPHVTPLIALWKDDSLYFCTGPGERKAKNLAKNRHCILTTGCNSLKGGLDLIVEGEASRVTDDDKLRRLADAYVAKYGEDWRFGVKDGAFTHEAGNAYVFEVAPRAVFGFAKGDPFGQTRYQF